MPKNDPRDVARQIVDGIEHGDAEVLADDVTRHYQSGAVRTGRGAARELTPPYSRMNRRALGVGQVPAPSRVPDVFGLLYGRHGI